VGAQSQLSSAKNDVNSRFGVDRLTKVTDFQVICGILERFLEYYFLVIELEEAVGVLRVSPQDF
jgi:hypothetical protein